MYFASKQTFTFLTLSFVLLFAVVNSNPEAYSQYFGGDSAPLTQEQIDKCERYDISPCTQNNILAKERLIAAQGDEWIYFTAISQGTTDDHEFEASIAWLPADLGQPNKFHIEIFDAKQLEPRSPLPVRYDIKIYQGDKYLRPAEPTGNEAVQNEDYSHDYTFVFLQEGSYVLAIEEIESEGENIMIPIQVTPEFPIIIPIIASAIALVILISRTMKIQGLRY